jgi:hypothetical protein
VLKKGDVPAMFRVGQNRIYTPYITVYWMISLPKIPYIYRIYMVLANPSFVISYPCVHCIWVYGCVAPDNPKHAEIGAMLKLKHDGFIL